MVTHIINRQEICLLPEKAVFWKDKEMLILADLHISKAGHFRKGGIPIPSGIHEEDLNILSLLLHNTQAKHLLFLGDLFHSVPNAEWEVFSDWLDQWLQLGEGRNATLVMGNHDLHGRHSLPNALNVCDMLQMEGFLFTHEPMPPTTIEEGLYNLSGHLHPALIMKGKGKQQLRLPCFYFGEKQAYLPAFGKFTGLMPIYPDGHEDVFVIAEGKIFSW